MSFFQESVKKKYLSELDSELLDNKYRQFLQYFNNKDIQQNIRSAKEEQFQEGFLRELFVNILGYTLYPQPEYNLTTELKNTANNKKVDGAILKNSHAVAVIELKGTDTSDLDKVESQAFGYKNHNPKCIYVITSNFEKIRFYIQNAVEHLNFNLFDITREQFALMWLCLAKENLLNDIPLRMKESSLLQEENITKKLYADYSKFREAIYNNLVKNNPEQDKLLLFKKTQKLLDRFLFIFFAEDRLLIPPNSIREIINQWETMRDVLDEYTPLYSRFKKHFGYLNTGFKNKNTEIFAYNGGLFAPDEILDNITIDDNILYEHTLRLSQYNFDTEVDVNILGHIFEHSLGEIESVQAEIKGEIIDAQKTKRKKDGIFYTPKYITKYIVENTVGKLCIEKRFELGIIDEEYAKGRKNRKREAILELDKKLTDYRNWLLNITILDPACGSGAFLNQALDFLINEHQKIDNLRAQLLEEGLVFADITSDILENNIYGVDINEESVEIAKLSLWLRTAQIGRKLNSLSGNIKCGNSLIDEPAVAGDKAFNWELEFPDIFRNGGFDVVIGNPPYAQSDIKEKKYLDDKYNLKTLDTTMNFIRASFDFLKINGLLGFIIPKSFLIVESWKLIREFVLTNTSIHNVNDVGMAFNEVGLETIIINYRKGFNQNNNVEIFSNFNLINSISQSFFINKGKILTYLDSKKFDLLQKLENDKLILSMISIMPRGISVNSTEYSSSNNEGLSQVFGGTNLQKYLIKNGNTRKPNRFLECSRKEILNKENIFSKKRIIYQNLVSSSPKIIATITNGDLITDDTLNNLILIDDNFCYEYVLCLLNSKLYIFYLKFVATNNSILTVHLDIPYLGKFPIPNISPEAQLPFIALADKMLEMNKELKEKENKFVEILKADFNIQTISSKLENWTKLNWSEFEKELNKQKITLSGAKKEDWFERFNRFKSSAQELKSVIDQTDKQIDQLVYELYELSEEEIRIVEGE